MSIRARWAFGLLLLLTVPVGCTLDSLEDDVQLYVDTDFLKPVATIQVMSANGSGDPVDNVVVTASGAGADLLYRIDGKKELKPVDGFLSLGVLPSTTLLESDPLTFTLTARANGYVTSARAFAVVDTESPAYQSLELVELASPPTGTSVEQASVASNGSGTTTAATRVRTSAGANAVVDIPEGLQLLDASGAPVGGSVQVTAVQYNPRSSASTALPTTSVPGVDAQGNSLGDVYFINPSTALGGITIEMSAGATEVARFSSPITVTYDVPAGLTNPATGAPYAPGDQADVWSFDEANSRWVLETQATVVDNGGVLQATYAQSHLSTWMVGAAVPPGVFFFQAQVQSGIPASTTFQRYFYAELVEEGTGVVLGSESLRLKNTEIITFFFVPNTTARVRVYDGNQNCKGNLLGESARLSLSSFVGAVSLPNLTLENTTNWRVTTTGRCANNTNIIIAPSVDIHYKDATCGPNQWGLLGQMTGGILETYALALGDQYDFSVKVGDSNFEYEDITMETQTVAYDDGTVDIVVTTAAGAGGVSFSTINVGNVVYPATLCTAFTTN